MDIKVLIITIVISIICGVLANLGTPYIKQFFVFSLSGLRKARIREYSEELVRLTIYVHTPNDLILFLFHEVFVILCFISLGFALYFISYSYGKAFLSLALYSLSYALGKAFGKLRLIKAVRQYDSYRQKRLEQIQKLKAKLAKEEGKD